MGVRKNVVDGLKLRHDYGPPSFVREPDGSSIAERFIRILKDNLVWVQSVQTTRSCGGCPSSPHGTALTGWSPSSPQEKDVKSNEATYDVFLSYHWRDHTAVEAVARALNERALKVFLDRWYLMPGRPWQEALQASLGRSAAVAIFIGPEGLGDWQQREAALALDRQTHSPAFPVIPILLPGADPPLGFLALNTWIDLRGGVADEARLSVIAHAALGEPPGPGDEMESRRAIASVCPYRGLRYFREEDASLFCGRAAFSERLIRTLSQKPLIAVLGASGSGKSSVVRAGLFPTLRQAAAPTWETAVLVPGDQPLKALAAALIPLLSPDLGEVDRLAEIGKLAGYFVSDGILLRDVAGRILARSPGIDRLLLFVDQWEELYTLCAEDEARRFIAELLTASAAAPMTVVLTLRGDFFGRALADRALADRLQDAVVTLGPMTRDELKEAIEEPSNKVGLAFEPGLVNRILDDVGDEPGNLPLLEFTLEELWRARQGNTLHHAAYDAFGGVPGAIASRAEEVFLQALSEPEREEIRRVLIRLVRPGEGTEDTRRRAPFPTGEVALTSIHKLVDARLLVTGLDAATGKETAEITHEALIRTWKRLKAWVDADRDFLRTRDRIEAAAALWRREGERDDRLLPTGRPVAEAEEVLAKRRDDLDTSLATYIETSLDAERQRQAQAEQEHRRQLMRARLIAGAMALLALIAVGVSWIAWRSSEYSNKMTVTATEIAAGRVTDALRVADSAGMSREWIEQLLVGTDAAFNKLFGEAADSPWVPWRSNRISRFLRSEYAKLLLAFADHYGIIGNNDQHLENAKKARAIFDQLVHEEPSSVDWRHELAFCHDVVGDALNWKGQPQEALKAYETSLDIREELAASPSQSSNDQWQRDVSMSKNKIGDVLRRQGKLQEALTVYQDGLTISRRLASTALLNTELQRDILVTEHKIGDILAKQGQWDGAETAYKDSLAISGRLATADPANTQFQRDLEASHEKVGNALIGKGHLEAAIAAFRASLVIAERQATADPTNAVLQRDLSLCYEKLGDAFLKKSEIEAAISAFRTSSTIRQRLLDARPADSWFRRDLSVSQDKLGEALEAQGKLEDALAIYQESLAIREGLAAADSSNAQSQRDLSLTHDRIARVLSKKKQFAEAMSERQMSLAIAKQLADAHPLDAKWQWELSICYDNIGDLLVAQRLLDQALNAYVAARTIRERLTAGDPSHTEWQRALAKSHRKIGNVLANRGYMDGAVAAYRLELALLERLATANPSDVQLQQELSNAYERLKGER